jgi:hypothetical protein
LDAVAWERLTATFTDATVLRALLEEQERRLSSIGQDRLAELETQAGKLRKKEERALSLMLDADLASDRATIKEHYQQARAVRMRLESEIGDARHAQQSIGAVGQRLSDVVTAIQAFVAVAITAKQKQEFVRRLVSRADWNGEELKMRCVLVPELATTS